MFRALPRAFISSYNLGHRRYMASSSALEALPNPLRDLVATAASSADDFGTSDKDKVDVSEWIIKVAKGDVVQPSATKDLESMLTPKTYLVSNYLTAADVALYGALHPMLSQLQPPQYYLIPSITRYFDHIQNRPSVRKAADSLSPAYSLVTFDLDNMPKLERKVDPPKKKEKKTTSSDTSPPEKKSSKKKEEITNETVNAAKITKDAVPKDDKKTKEKKQPKEKGAPEGGKKSGGKNISPAVAEDAGEPVPSMIDLRVGKIVDIKKHPDADSLYVEQIDFGEETGPRTVVSGLVNYIPIENMRDKILVGVCNLKPANMRGIKSFAMVLCASSKEGKEGGIELIQPPPDSQPGDRIYFEGEKFENASPLSQLNPKKKIFETVQPGFTTLESREAAWIDPVTKSVHKIRSAKGVCQAPTLVGASLS